MTISNATKEKLNKSNRAMQDASGGTLLQNLETLSSKIDAPFQTGSLTVSEAQATASAISLDTGQTGISGFIVQRYVSGSFCPDLHVVNSGSVLDIDASTGSKLLPGDIIYWITI